MLVRKEITMMEMGKEEILKLKGISGGE